MNRYDLNETFRGQVRYIQRKGINGIYIILTQLFEMGKYITISEHRIEKQVTQEELEYFADEQEKLYV